MHIKFPEALFTALVEDARNNGTSIQALIVGFLVKHYKLS